MLIAFYFICCAVSSEYVCVCVNVREFVTVSVVRGELQSKKYARFYCFGPFKCYLQTFNSTFLAL